MYLSDNKEDFLAFPHELYVNDPFYITQAEDVSACEKLFVVKEDEKVLCRAGFLSGGQLGFLKQKTILKQLNFYLMK